MMYLSSYSQLFSDYPAYFIMLCGLHLTWVTGIFNLNSTAGVQFNWIFIEPLFYFLIVFLDATGVVDRKLARSLYVSFFLVTLGRYLVFMRNVVVQICGYMGLKFLTVKDKAPASKKVN